MALEAQDLLRERGISVEAVSLHRRGHAEELCQVNGQKICTNQVNRTVTFRILIFLLLWEATELSMSVLMD